MVPVLLAMLAAAPQNNVILVTWDGVRWQDFFDRGEGAPMQRFWSRHAARSTVLGAPGSNAKFEVANDSLVSLPGYQELMVGGPVDCTTNLCGPVKQRTLLDRLVAAGLASKLAVLGSWGSIGEAASAERYGFVDAGNQPGDPRAPWGARLDRGTWLKAMATLEHEPRFLWIALNDADEWGHRGRRDTYLLTLHRYDIWLDELLQRLAAMGEYGERTTVIVTTDYGRGDGDAWTGHGWAQPEARRIFAVVIGPHSGGTVDSGTWTHRAVRPTVETLLGLASSGPVLPGVTPLPPPLETTAAARIER
jgi:hypothetical protein